MDEVRKALIDDAMDHGGSRSRRRRRARRGVPRRPRAPARRRRDDRPRRVHARRAARHPADRGRHPVDVRRALAPPAHGQGLGGPPAHEGFRRFIDESEKERARFAERKNLFSEYLPYAIVFGATEKWAARSPVSTTSRPTRLVPVVVAVHVPASRRLDRRLQRDVGGTLTSTPPSSSSGSSGFSRRRLLGRWRRRRRRRQLVGHPGRRAAPDSLSWAASRRPASRAARRRYRPSSAS